MYTSEHHTLLARQQKWWNDGKKFKRLRTKGYEKFRRHPVCLLPHVAARLSKTP